MFQSFRYGRLIYLGFLHALHRHAITSFLFIVLFMWDQSPISFVKIVALSINGSKPQNPNGVGLMIINFCELWGETTRRGYFSKFSFEGPTKRLVFLGDQVWGSNTAAAVTWYTRRRIARRVDSAGWSRAVVVSPPRNETMSIGPKARR